MSRVIVFGLDNKSLGEFDANVDRSWTIDGSPASSGGGSSTIVIPDSVAAMNILQFGQMIMVTHDNLPVWAGMIDTPWKALLPVQLTAYNAEYLLSQRCPDGPITMQAPLAQILNEMINQANIQEEMYIRLGNVDGLDGTIRQESFDQRPFWDQMKALLLRAGCEMTVRPQRDPTDGNRLYIYLDVKKQVGIDTGYLLHDGENANIKIADASVEGTILNRVTGISGESTQTSRKQTIPQLSIDSLLSYRLRSIIQQFQGVIDDATLLANAVNFLNQNAAPKLKLTIQILDVGNAFSICAPGNIVLLHGANLWLPGGVHGWRGFMRLITLEYAEGNNTLSATVIGTL